MSCGRCLRGYEYQLMAEEDLSAMMSRKDLMELPPGFRFHPTDEEIITNYLTEKVLHRSFSPRAMGEVDLNKCEPWDLPSKAVMGEKEWYFYCHKDKKYPTGSRTNRATKAGYWKATGKDKEIYREDGKCLVGMKKTLVFYEGRAPKGQKTNWVMHEYRLEGKSSHHLPKAERDEWAVCRVTHKNTQPIKKSTGSDQMITIISPSTERLYTATLPPLMGYPYPNYPNTSRPSSSSMTKNMKNGGCGDFQGNSSTTAINHHQLDPYNINTTPPTFPCYPQYVPNPTPSVIPTSSPMSTIYLHHNSNTGPTDSNQQVTLKAPGATEDAASPHGWRCKEEQYSSQSLVTASPAISNDRSTGNSSVVPMPQDPQQLASCGSLDDIEHILRFFA